MVRKAKAGKNNKRKPSRRPNNRRSLLRFPPVISFNKCFMDVTLRHIKPFSKQPINSRVDISFSISDAFSGPWASLRSVFSEVKLRKVHIYAMSGVGFEDRGFHALNVAPKSEFSITDKTTFSTLASLPGSRVNRLTRMISGIWFPTQPSERIWLSTSSNAALLDVVYMSSDQASNGSASVSYPVEITIDAHVRVRGVNYVQMVNDGDEVGAMEFISISN